MFPITRCIYYYPSPVATSVYGVLYYDCGSRCDWKGHEGITHFLEHMLFKGAGGLSPRALFERIERYGGELNAFTTKDKMAVEFWVPPDALETALHVVRLIVEEAALSDVAVERERQVILEELAMYEDIPEEMLLDRYEEVIFLDGGLRHPIIGYRASLLATSGEVLRRYYREVFQRSPWVLLIGGAVSGRGVERALRRTGWLLRESPQNRLWQANETWTSSTAPLVETRPIQQAHIVVGGLGPSPYEKEGVALQLVLQALGGPFLSSTLNLLLRERYGWAYNVYSFFHGYPEKGVWGIYAGVMPQVERRALELIQRMLALWQEHPVSERRLGVLKRQFWGRQAILWERLSYRLQVQGRWILDTGQPLEETAWKQEVLALSPANLQEAAQKYLSKQWIAALRPGSD
jgi:predicted Zn-dependent peptidase